MIKKLLLLIENFLKVKDEKLQDIKKELELSIIRHDELSQILKTEYSINNLLISDKKVDEILNESCELLSQYSNYILAWIGIVEEYNISIVAHSSDSTNYVSNLKLSINPSDITSLGPSAKSIIENRTIITQSININYYSIWNENAKRAGIASSISIPLREFGNSKPFGAIAIYSSKPFGFIEQEIRMLENLAGYIGYIITSRNKKEQLISALTTDQLTKLPNRYMLLDRLSNDTNISFLLIININRFKDINAIYGFEAGDFILQSFATYLNNSQKSNYNGVVYKLHSDTFAILFEKDLSQNSVEQFILNIAHNLSETTFQYNEIDILLTISCGYSDKLEHIIENCEIALKYAKQDKVVFKKYNFLMRENTKYINNIECYKVIKDAIKNDRIIPYFQAIVDTKNKKIIKYEALARVILKDGSIATPSQFLNVSKKIGLYPMITKIVTKKTLELFKNIPNYKVAINLSAEDIINIESAKYLYDLVKESNIANRVIFEILESEGIANYEKVNIFISKLKALGCSFAIDDFGSVFSNFEYIIKLKIDYLKIDGSLIKNLSDDKNAEIIVRNINNFAQEMGIKTVAEFVNSKDIYDIVNKIGIDYSQGYFFEEPKIKI